LTRKLRLCVRRAAPALIRQWMWPCFLAAYPLSHLPACALRRPFAFYASFALIHALPLSVTCLHRRPRVRRARRVSHTTETGQHPLTASTSSLFLFLFSLVPYLRSPARRVVRSIFEHDDDGTSPAASTPVSLGSAPLLLTVFHPTTMGPCFP